MGIQGPLTAQALGRSPYDDAVFPENDGQDDPSPQQEYDYRGRPMNPRTKQVNRSIIRAHNEVMHVVGVAEPDNMPTLAEFESKEKHADYETEIGLRLIWATKRCVEAVGAFGVNGFRQRVLVYKHYSHTPCWDLYQAARNGYSFTRDLLPGAPASLMADYVDRRYNEAWAISMPQNIFQSSVEFAGRYIAVHLQLYASLQRLGLISSTQLLPTWRFFVPFTRDSLIAPPPPPDDLTPKSLLKWAGGVVVSAAPVILFAMTQRLTREWRMRVWERIFPRIPNPIIGGREILPMPELVRPDDYDNEQQGQHHDHDQHDEHHHDDQHQHQHSHEHHEHGHEHHHSEQHHHDHHHHDENSHEHHHHHHHEHSEHHPHPDDYGSDDDTSAEGVTTLISFDVDVDIEPQESAAPQTQGWSAELRPSAPPEGATTSSSGPARSPAGPLYLSTMLTRMPSLMAALLSTDRLVRLLMLPHEAMALRLAARAFSARHGLPTGGMFGLGLLEGVGTTWLVNLAWAELVHLTLSAEVWSVFTMAAGYFHLSEEEWEAFEDKDFAERMGRFRMSEALV